MEAKELRLGNLLHYRDKDHILLEVSNLGHFFETVDYVDGLKYGSDDIKEYNGIPLTEEWLLKFGFEKGDDILGDCFYIERQYIDDFVIHHYKNTSFEFFPYDVTVKHVHQLQNLFYALSGEELTFND